jgi:hypothetical protein
VEEADALAAGPDTRCGNAREGVSVLVVYVWNNVFLAAPEDRRGLEQGSSQAQALVMLVSFRTRFVVIYIS